ncbi:MAG: hypothetical protein ACI3VQ_03040 [Faecousia sp.]
MTAKAPTAAIVAQCICNIVPSQGGNKKITAISEKVCYDKDWGDSYAEEKERSTGGNDETCRQSGGKTV